MKAGRNAVSLLVCFVLSSNVYAVTVPQSEAVALAKGMVLALGNQSNIEQDWIGAQVIDSPTIYFSSNGLPIAYEFSVMAPTGEARGSVHITAFKARGVERSYSTQGYSDKYYLKKVCKQ